MTGLAYRRDVLAHRIFQIQADDVLPGNHDFPGQTVGKIKDVADELAFYLIYLPFLVAGRDEKATLAEWLRREKQWQQKRAQQ